MDSKQRKTITIPIKSYQYILFSLLLMFMVYNFWVYNSTGQHPIPPMKSQAMRGGMLWQKNNCTSCHQLYGLGGYLGPDLTNVISNPRKGPLYVSAMINSGIKAMPKYNFTNKEKKDIIAFLAHVDSTGFFPNKNPKFNKWGWINLKYKNFESARNE